MSVADPVFYVIVLGCFLAAVCNAAFAAGGAQIVLAVTSAVLPVSAIVPVHSTLLAGSTFTRLWLFRSFIDTGVVRSFLIGSVIGAALGARTYLQLPEALLAIVISVLMLVGVWLPKVRWRPRLRHPWVVVGFLHTLISTLFAYGAILQAVILQTRLDRKQIMGTMAGCLSGMALFKISAYVYYGFDYRPYLLVITCGIVVSFAGTWLGKMIIDRISERVFRFTFRALVSVAAIRLLYSGLATVVQP